MNFKKYFSGMLITVSLLLSVQVLAQESATQATRSPSAPGATASIANLSDGDVVPSVFTVKFAIEGMEIAPAGSQIQYTGHHHLLIDVDKLPNMNLPLPATDHIRHFGKGQTEVELSLPPGPHTLQLLLADYAHMPHFPPVLSKKITVNVKAP